MYRLLEHTKSKRVEYLAIANSQYTNPEEHHIYHALNACTNKLEEYQDLLS